MQLRCANSGISHQLRYVNTVGRVGGDVAVNIRKINNPKWEVISLVVDTKMERCVSVNSLDSRV